jgi:hypothetical protein
VMTHSRTKHMILFTFAFTLEAFTLRCLEFFSTLQVFLSNPSPHISTCSKSGFKNTFGFVTVFSVPNAVSKQLLWLLVRLYVNKGRRQNAAGVPLTCDIKAKQHAFLTYGVSVAGRQVPAKS